MLDLHDEITRHESSVILEEKDREKKSKEKRGKTGTLVVDDEKDIQTLFEQRFRKEIRAELVDFVFAFSGEEALECMKDLEQETVLILSDINMPGMSGLELLKHIKQKYFKPEKIQPVQKKPISIKY
mgnify:CR=1 FL=1